MHNTKVCFYYRLIHKLHHILFDSMIKFIKTMVKNNLYMMEDVTHLWTKE